MTSQTFRVKVFMKTEKGHVIHEPWKLVGSNKKQLDFLNNFHPRTTCRTSLRPMSWKTSVAM